MNTFDVCYLNQQKQVVHITVQANGRSDAFNQVKSKPDCRQYHHVPNIVSITQCASAPN